MQFQWTVTWTIFFLWESKSNSTALNNNLFLSLSLNSSFSPTPIRFKWILISKSRENSAKLKCNNCTVWSERLTKSLSKLISVVSLKQIKFQFFKVSVSCSEIFEIKLRQWQWLVVCGVRKAQVSAVEAQSELHSKETFDFDRKK